MTKRNLSFVFVLALACGVACSVATLSGCATDKPVPTPPPTVVVTGCEHFRLLTASRSDTAVTKQEILAHNAEFIKACGKK